MKQIVMQVMQLARNDYRLEKKEKTQQMGPMEKEGG